MSASKRPNQESAEYLVHLSEISKITGLSESYLRHLFAGHTKSGHINPLKALEILWNYCRSSNTKQELEKQKLAFLTEQTRLKELERRQKEGELIEVEEVIRIWIGILSIIKERLLQLPVILSVKTGNSEIQKHVQEEVDAMLKELSKDISNEIRKAGK